MTPEQIEGSARTWIGTPFHHQASVRKTGCDCLGLIRGVYRECGGMQKFDVPTYSLFWSERAQFDLHANLSAYLINVPIATRRIGDVALLRMRLGGNARHMGIIAGDEQTLIHCDSKYGVTEVPFSRVWLRLCIAIFRFKEVRT